MLIQSDVRAELETFSERLGLVRPLSRGRQDRSRKTEQVIAYLEEIHARLRHASARRRLVLVEPAAGNCALSFAAAHFYRHIVKRPVEIHCIDTNAALMQKHRETALALGFSGMHFHAGDIADFHLPVRPDIVYALHACNTASDKAIFWGIAAGARNILNVSCCQHGFLKRFRPRPVLRPLGRHAAARERLAYLAADSLRALLLEMTGYRTDLVEFVSSRATGKNMLVRAEYQPREGATGLADDYRAFRTFCGTGPELETLLGRAGLVDLEFGLPLSLETGARCCGTAQDAAQAGA